MIILTIRTDKPEAEIGLYHDQAQLAYVTWQAHRLLAETLHRQITDMLSAQQKSFADIKGVVGFAGPGSFTGLRIGLSVANALAYSYSIPAIEAQGEQWLDEGIQQLLDGKGKNGVILPEYGGDIFITPPRK